VTDGKASFNIKISMQGTLPQLNSRLKQKKLEELAAQQVKEQIMGTYLKGLKIGVDLLGLSDKVYKELPDEWKKLEEEGNLPLDKNSITAIDVNVKLMSGGIAKIKQH
jgi:uncharacterized protein YidB (DUF937 family)